MFLQRITVEYGVFIPVNNLVSNRCNMNKLVNFQINNDFEDLLDQQQAGFTLDQAFYNHPDVYQIDLSSVLAKQWHFVDHESRIPNPGDYITHNFGDESIIIVRTKEGDVVAHFNVCRHRGSRLCLEEQGSTKRLVCPYHAWSYSLDGELKMAKQMSDDFKREDYSLHPCRVEVLEGLIFVNLNPDDAPEFAKLADDVRSFIKPHGIPNAKIAVTKKYLVDANWKLVVENFRECYHCTPSHPEYSAVNAYVRAGDKQMGGYLAEVEKWQAEHADSEFELGFKNFPDDLQPHHAWRMPIRNGFKTATKDGLPAAPLMGDFTEYDDAETGLFFGAMSYFYFNNDYATTFSISPKSVTQTEVVVNWLVHKDAVAGVDYDPGNISWLWDVTTVQDGEITENNQKGVNSTYYQPGPYSEREYGTADFTAWYLWRLKGGQDKRVRFR